MTSKITMFLTAFVVALGMFLGFSTNDDPNGSKTNTSSSTQGVNDPPHVTAAYYTDNFDAANDTTALKARGYNVYYRGGGPQGVTALWYQGTDAVFPAFNGPLTGYVAANYNVVTGSNNIDSWMVLPRLNVGSGDTISFYSRAPLASTFPDSIRVMYSAAGDSTPEATSWVTLGRFKVNTAGIWEKKAYTTASAGANGRFAIRYCVVNGGPLGVNSDFIGIDALNVSTGGTGPVSCNLMWAPQTSGTTQALLSVSAVSNDVAWAGGNGPTVVKTVDGTSWSSATGTGITGAIYNICGIDANTALCTTTPATTTFIYRTSNGGTTWTQVFSQSGGFIDAIKMLDATTGYAMGDPVGGTWVILKTTNGGVNWTQMPGAPTAPAGEAGWNNSFDVEGNNMWWLTNAINGKIYRSTNAGANFTSSISGVVASSYGSIKFAANGLDGIVTSNSGTAVKSIDGGATWTPITAIPGGACTAVETGLNGTNIDFYGTGGLTIQRSTNGGTNWTTATTATGAINDVYFTTFNGCPVGWAVSATGAISKMSLITGIGNYNTEIPNAYNLNQNYPNPFNPSTNINFSIPKSGLVTLKIYDMVGREVASLVNEFKAAGNYIVGFNASSLSSGTYFYRLESNDFIATKKMVLIK